MSIPVPIWNKFNSLAWVPDYNERETVTADISAVESEERLIRALPTCSPKKMLEAARKEIPLAIDAAEQRALRHFSRGCSPMRNLVARWHVNSGAVASAFEDRQRWQHEYDAFAPGRQFDFMRRLVTATLDIHAEAIRKGEIPDESVAPLEKEARLADAENRLAALKEKLEAVKARLAWAHDGKRDRLEDCIHEYASAQEGCPGLPLAPEHRITSHPAYGAIDGPNHENADSVRITEPARLENWQKLFAFLKERTV